MTLKRKPKRENKWNIILGCIVGLVLLLHFLPIGLSFATEKLKLGDDTISNTGHSAAELENEGGNEDISDIGDIVIMKSVLLDDEEGIINNEEGEKGEILDENLEEEVSGKKGVKSEEKVQEETKGEEDTGEISELKRGETGEKGEGLDGQKGGVDENELDTKGSEIETQGDGKGGKENEVGDPKAPSIAILLPGNDFNSVLSDLTRGDLSQIVTITGTVNADICKGDTIISDPSSAIQVDASIGKNGVLTYCTTAPEIYLNASSEGMFAGLTNLTSIKLSDFNTSMVETMAGMFHDCLSLVNLDLSSFDTSNVKYMNHMFSRCSSLTSLDLSGFNTSKLNNVNSMFESCSELETIYVGKYFDRTNIEHSDNMFYGAENLVGGFGTMYDPKAVDGTLALPDDKDNQGYFTKDNVLVSFRDENDEIVLDEVVMLGKKIDEIPDMNLNPGQKVTRYTAASTKKGINYGDEFDFGSEVNKYTRLYAQISCDTGYVEDTNGNCVRQVFVTFVANPSTFSAGHFSGGETTKTLEYRQAPEGYYYAVTQEIQVPNLDPVGETGYMFEGWYTATGYTSAERWIGLTTGTAYNSITLYARYLPFKDKTVTRDGVTFTIMDRNLGATAASSGYTYNTSDSTTRGRYFQWGNNFGFSNAGALSNTLSGILVKNYTNTPRGPGNYYYNGTYILRPSTPFYRNSGAIKNDNLWGGNSASNPDIYRQGPCPDGYHVPYSTEWTATINLFDKWNATEDGSTYCNSLTNSGSEYCLPAILGLSYAGLRYNSSAGSPNSTYQKTRALYRSANASTSSTTSTIGYAYRFYTTSGRLPEVSYNQTLFYKADGFPIRCFKNTENLTLTFDSKGGSSVANQTNFRRWQKRSAPSAPTRAHSTFLGRYKDRYLVEPVTWSNFYVSDDTTLYAKWSCDTGYTDVGNACLDTTAPTCIRGQPSNTTLKAGETGSITLTCTDEVGITSNALSASDINFSNPYVMLTNVVIGGNNNNKTYTFTYMAADNVNGEVDFILSSGKVSDQAGNGNDEVKLTDFVFQSDGTITVCDPNNSIKCITIQDRNLGAINSDTTSTGSHGYHYQWGNNHGFASCFIDNCDTFPGGESTSNSQINCSANSPSNPVNSSAFIVGYTDYCTTSTRNYNLRGGSGDSQSNNRGFDTGTNTVINATDRKGPCDTGYHTPSIGDRIMLSRYWAANYTGLGNDLIEVEPYYFIDYWFQDTTLKAIEKFKQDFKISHAAKRYGDGLEYSDQIAFWSSSPKEGSESSIGFLIDPDAAYTYNDTARLIGLSVRCFKDTPNTGFTRKSAIVVDSTVPDMVFTGDTPAHNATIGASSFTSQIEITESNLSGFRSSFDGVQTSLYDDSLVLMYNFDKLTSLGESNVVVKDMSKYGNDGTINSPALILDEIKGRRGGGYTFNGGNINAGNDESLRATSNFTVSVWIKTTQASNTTYNYFLDRYNTSSKRVWGLAYRNAKILVLSSKTGGVNSYSLYSTNTVNDGNWHLVTLVHNGSKIQLYIDGELNGEKAAAALYDTDTPLTIGKTSSFRGQLDEVRMYNRALSATEIQELYHSNLERTDTDKWLYTAEHTRLTAGSHTYGGIASDEIGNESSIYRDINIDISAPTVVLSSTGSGMCAISGDVYTVTGSFSEAVTGINASTLSVSGGTVQSFTMVSGDTAVWTVKAGSSYMHYGNGTITICDPNDSTKCITMQDKNLGASEIGTGTASYGYHFQRGNNHGFAPNFNGDTSFPGGESIGDTQETNCANYGPAPLGRYDSNTFILELGDWCNPRNDNLRGGANDTAENNYGFDETDNVATNVGNRRGPCEDGYHVPSQGERGTLLKYWAANYTGAGNTLNLSYSSGLPKFSSNATAAGQFQEDFKIPFAGYRDNNDAKVYHMGYYANLWSSSPYVGYDYARVFYLSPTEASADNYNLRASAFSLRCFKDSYLSFPSSEEVLTITVETGVFSDLAGNANTTGSNIISIDYDTQAPDTPSMIAEPTYTSGTSNTVSSTEVSDNGCKGHVRYQFCKSTTNSTDDCTGDNLSYWSDYPHSHTFSNLSNGQKYYYFVRADDFVNVSEWSASTYSTQDSVGPTITLNPNGSSTPSQSYDVDVTVTDGLSGLPTQAQTLQYAWEKSCASGLTWEYVSIPANGIASISSPAGLDGNYYLCIKGNSVYDVAGNTASSLQKLFSFDNTAPTPQITTTTYVNSTTQTVSLSCGKDAFSYYWGTKVTPSARDFVPVNEGQTSSATYDIPDQTINRPGTYYLWCKDTAGNSGSSSIAYFNYAVYNMQETATGKTSVYNTKNYDLISSGTYLYPARVTLPLSSVYTNPNDSCDTFTGMSIGTPDSFDGKLHFSDPYLSQKENFTMWFTRNKYDLTLVAGSGSENLKGSGNYKRGELIDINADIKTGYTWSGWTKIAGIDLDTFVPTQKHQEVSLACGDATLRAETIDHTSSIFLQATATSANQTLTISKYFANAYTVDRGDGTTGNLTADTTHTYTTAGTYTIILSLSGANRWQFRTSIPIPLVPKSGTTVTGVKITYMPSLADGFGNSAANPGNHFFSQFNRDGAITSLPAGSFDTSSIRIVGDRFFTSFNNSGSLTSLPEGSFNTSNISGTVGDAFFGWFNSEGKITSLPSGSFNISNITVVGDDFFDSFNQNGSLMSLPNGSFNISNISGTVGDNFFGRFNYKGSLTSLPDGSFDTTNITTVGDKFFCSFNYYGNLISLPNGSFDISNITMVGNGFFSSFNEIGHLTSLSTGSFDTSKITGTVGDDFFASFNYEGELQALPDGSFNISNIASAGSGFFYLFNALGSVTSLPDGSFDTSNITSLGDNSFAFFNYGGAYQGLPSGSFNLGNVTSAGENFFHQFNTYGKIINLPSSFTISSVGASVTGGYEFAFYSSDYTLNRNVYDLVSGVVAPSSDRNTFSDNQLKRCGVHENWLETTADACSITYNSNGGSTIANPTKKYTADTTGVVAGSGITTPTRANSQFVGWYTGIQTGNQVTTVLFPAMDSGTLYAFWSCDTGYKISGDACILNKDIVLQATATAANQTLKINKYFANAYTVDRGDGSVVENVTTGMLHTYSTPGTYTITLSLTGTASRWKFQNQQKPLVPKNGMTMTGVQITYMPALADGFGNSATTPGDYFFYCFNSDGKLTSLPSGSFNLSNITTAGDYFFSNFNSYGRLTSLPTGSFNTSNISGTVGDCFFNHFNYYGRLTSLPTGSFNIENISTAGGYFFSHFNDNGALTSLPTGSFRLSTGLTTAGGYFFSFFNYYGALTSLPTGSFNTENISTAGGYFFAHFNNNGALTSLPTGSFKLSTGLTEVGNDFFTTFNKNGALTSLPTGSFNTENITTVGDSFFLGFNSYGRLTSLPTGSFNTSNISGTVGDYFFNGFNSNGQLTSLPSGSFNLSNITTAGDFFFYYFNNNGRLTSLPTGSFNLSNITTAGDYFFSYFNNNGRLTSLPTGSFRLSTGLTEANSLFFSYFNSDGALTSLPTGSFNTENITTARGYFFSYFNNNGRLTSLPSGSFNLSNITTARGYFFSYFNNSGRITNLPDSFKLTGAAYDKTGGYENAFNSTYTINKNVSDLVSGVVAPADDRNTFSDNQPKRCGVDPNWLVSTANACSITYDSNGGSTIANPTKKYTADTTSVVAGSGITTPTRANSQFVGWYTGIQTGSQVTTVLFPAMDSGTLYAFWSCDTGYKISGDACVLNKDIVLQATATSANQKLKINKYFANAYTVDRGDGSAVQNLTADTTHTYSTAGTYTITLSLSGTATRWTFQNVSKPLVPKNGTTMTGVQITYMPALADGFGNSATTPGNYFFMSFNKNGAIISLPEGSFDTSNITTAGNNFFDSFNSYGSLTSLPGGSFRLSPRLTTAGDGSFAFFNSYGSLTSLPDGSFDTSNITKVGDYFFEGFNEVGSLTSLPGGSFNTSNITTAGDYFFYTFNEGGSLTSLPGGSFDTSNITTAGNNFFDSFNSYGSLTSLPGGSFRLSPRLTTAGDYFFVKFNGDGSLTSLPDGSFDTSNITKVGDYFFEGFNAYGSLTSLPGGSFNTSNITTAGNDFFSSFNYKGALTSLPDGSFDTSHITTAGDGFFASFNEGGSLTSLPDSFKLTSAAYDKAGGYQNAFNSPNYTLNKNVSDLVSGVTAPNSDRNTFSDNQPGRCGVNPNWLVSTADACSITYNSNGGSTIANPTKKYTADTTGVVAGSGITTPTRAHSQFVGWYTGIQTGNQVTTVSFPSMDSGTLYAHWRETVPPTVTISSEGIGMCVVPGTVYTVTGSFSEAVTGIDASTLTVTNGSVQDFQMISDTEAVWTVSAGENGGGSDYMHYGNGTITICDPDDSTKCITMQDKNLGATTNDITSTGSYGKHFQWGNNHGFLPGENNSAAFPGGESTSDSQINCSTNSPSNPVNSSAFIVGYPDYCTTRNDNLRGGENDTQENNRGFDETNNTVINPTDRQGPCGEGYHVPSIGEWNKVLEYWAEYNDITLTNNNGLKYNTSLAGLGRIFQEDFKIPFAGYRFYDDAKVYSMGNYAYLWSSSPYVGNVTARIFRLIPNEAHASNLSYRANARSLRCFKDSYLEFPSSEDGDSTVTVYIETGAFTDLAGNANTTGSNIISWNYDDEGPTSPTLSSPVNSGWVKTLKPTLSWNDDTQGVGCNTGKGGYEIWVCTDSGCDTAVQSKIYDTNTTTWTLTTNLTNGTKYYWKVRAKDGLGNWGEWSSIWSFTVDTTAPTLTEITAVTRTGNDATPNYVFKSSEAGTISYSGDCSSSTTSISADTNTTITFNTLSEGTHSNCQIYVTDVAGNKSPALDVSTFYIDTTKPVCTWGTPSRVSMRYPHTGSIILTCTDVVGIDNTSLSTGSITVSGSYLMLESSTVSGSATGRIFTFLYTIKPNSTGNFDVENFVLPANTIKDVANNYAATKKSNNITVDTIYPEYAGVSYVSGSDIYITGNYYYVKPGGSITLDVSHTDNKGFWRQMLRFYSSYGSINSYIQNTTFADQTANDTQIDIVSATCSDSDSNCSFSSPYDGDMTIRWYSTVGSSAVDRTYTIQAYAYDWVGNSVGYTNVGKTLRIDGTPPTINITQATHSQRTYYYTGTLKATITDNGAGVYTREYVITGSNECDADTTNSWTAYTDGTDLIFDSESYNGKYACFKAVDNLGNTQYLASDKIEKIDRTKPIVSATESSTVWKTSNITPIKMLAGDVGLAGLSGAKYYWTASSSTTFEQCWSSGIAYNSGATTSWTTEGTGYLHLCAYDNARNTGLRTGIYKLDKTAPSIGMTNSSTSWKTGDISIKLTASDATSGLSGSAKYYWTGVTSATLAQCWANGTTYKSGAKITDSTEGTRYLYVCAYDVAGNSKIASGIYKLDKTAPTCSIVEAACTSGTLTLTLTGSENITVSSGWENVDGTTYTKGVTSNSAVSATVTDVAGNTGSCNIIPTHYDTKGPTFTFEDDAVNECTAGSLSITGVVQVGCATAHASPYSFDNITWNSTSTFAFSTSTSQPGTGSKTAYVRDALGNVTSHTAIWTVSDVDPTAKDFTLNSKVGNSARTGDWKKLSKAEEGNCGNGALTASVTMAASKGTCSIDGDVITYTPNSNKTGNDKCDITIKDNENSSIDVTVSVEGIDTVGPTVTLTTNAVACQKATTYTITGTYSEAVNGVVTGDLMLTNASVVSFKAVSSRVYVWTVKANTTSYGTAKASVGANTATDGAGNNNVASNEITWTYDNAGPTFTFSDNTVDECTAGSLSITNVTQVGCAGAHSSPYSFDNSTWNSTSTFAFSTTTSQPGTGSKTAYVRDALGNTTSHTATWTVSNVAPTANNFTVDDVLTGKTVNWKILSSANEGNCGSGSLTATIRANALSTMGSCTINGDNISFEAIAGASGSATCVITIEDNENSSTVVRVIWNDVSRPVPQISFADPTPDDNSIVTQNRFTTKMNITNIDSIKSLNYQYKGSGYDLASGLVLMYNFDNEASLGESSTLVKDLSNNGNDGIVNGATWTSNGKYGGAYSFDGVDDYIQLPNDLGYEDSLSTFAWFKSNGTPKGGYHMVFGGVQRELSIPTSGKLRAGMHVNGSRTVDNYGSGLIDGNWHLVGMTYDGQTKNVYIDGKLVGTVNISGTLTKSFNRTIGRYGTRTDYYTNGQVDEVRIYNRALSQDEVQFLYKSNLKKTDVDIWEFETLNTCLDPDGTYNLVGTVESFVDTTGTTDRILTTNIPLVSVDGTGYNFGEYETTGAEYVLRGTMGTLTVTDKLGNSGWFVYLATSESLVGSATQEKISTENLKFKANSLAYNGMYEGYANTHVTFGDGISTTAFNSAYSSGCSNDHCASSSAKILEYMRRTADPNDFMCGDVGTYSDNTEIELEVPAWQVGDEYEGVLWITLQDAYGMRQWGTGATID